MSDQPLYYHSDECGFADYPFVCSCPVNEIARLRGLLRDALPSLGMNQRGYARAALEEACEALGENPEAWRSDALADRDRIIADLRSHQRLLRRELQGALFYLDGIDADYGIEGFTEATASFRDALAALDNASSSDRSA